MLLICGIWFVVRVPSAGPLPAALPHVARQPPAWPHPTTRLAALPHHTDARNAFQVDLRGADLSSLALRESGSDLAWAVFDRNTLWPPHEKLPAGFDPQRVMVLGKNPGLGVRALHARGITGRGVAIAVIDQPLLVQHQEYAGRLRLYEDVGFSRA